MGNERLVLFCSSYVIAHGFQHRQGGMDYLWDHAQTESGDALVSVTTQERTP